MKKTLGEEIKQAKPFQSLEQEAFLSILRTAAVLEDQFEQLLRPAGITGTQYNVLRILKGAEPEGLCCNDVRDRMLTRMPDVPRLLERMEAAGLIRRVRDTQDRRMVRTHVTEKGLALLAELEQAVAEEHQRRLGHLDAARLRELIDLLSDVRSAT